MAEISTKPYMLRAIHEWCTDSGLTPYIAVTVDEHTLVPNDFVRAGEIVLNISAEATNRLEISNELIQFQARFNGRAQELSIPVENVSAIYARENGHGMAFEVATAMAEDDDEDGDEATAPWLVSADDAEAESEDRAPVSDEPAPRARPALTAVPATDPPPEVSGDNGGSPDDDPDPEGDGSASSDDNNGSKPPPRGRPRLTRVK